MIEKSMNKIRIYSATKGKKEDTNLYKSIKEYKSCYAYKDLSFKENNKESLQKCYNTFLEDARRNSIDIAVIIHDDVYINCYDLYARLQDSAEYYTVFGVAGASSCKISNPALWHIMSERKDQRGCVAHGTPGQYSYTSFGPVPGRCLLIDGVLIGIDINKLPENVRFDESYPSKWHYYDLDFSLECNRNKVKIGVVDIPIIHESPGLTNPNQEFYKGQEYFIKKWKT
tara:strand:- start:1042 stop:1725 length:684 start_codon:yes stop_codon:yes gene_type:complete